MTGVNEQYYRYLSLFGLTPDFTQHELGESYRMLAKLNHPDIHRDATSQMRMVIINEGYRYLKENCRPAEPEVAYTAPPAADPEYDIYKKGFQILTRAFDSFYSEGVAVRSARMDRFVEELKKAKAAFALLIHNYPAGRWTGDAIDRIASINKWLEY